MNAQTIVLDKIFEELISSNAKYRELLENDTDQDATSEWMDKLDEEVFGFKQAIYKWVADAREQLDKDDVSTVRTVRTYLSRKSQRSQHSNECAHSTYSKSSGNRAALKIVPSINVGTNILEIIRKRT